MPTDDSVPTISHVSNATAPVDSFGIQERKSGQRAFATSKFQPDLPVKTSTSKWSSTEDELIVSLRLSGMKWDDIANHLDRSAMSCRMHYQNYLERRSKFSDEQKDMIAKLYERFKSDMWTPRARELTIPWRAVEAMHWQMGRDKMSHRAGVTPFALEKSCI